MNGHNSIFKMLNKKIQKFSILLAVCVVSNYVQTNGHLMLKSLKFDDHDNKVSENFSNILSEYIVNMPEIGPGLKGDPGKLEPRSNDPTQETNKETTTKKSVKKEPKKSKTKILNASAPKLKSSLHLFEPFRLHYINTESVLPAISEAFTTTEVTKPSTTTRLPTTTTSTRAPKITTTIQNTLTLKTPTNQKIKEDTSVVSLNTTVIPKNLTMGYHKDMSEECVLFQNGSDIDIIKMIDVWRAVYFQSADDVSCIKIILKGVSVKEQVDYAKEYDYLLNRIRWDLCHLEVKSTTNIRKHFLQGSSDDQGVFQNVILIKNETTSKMVLQTESPDQWRLIDDFLLMRDCDSGEVIVFSRVLKNPTKEELGRVLKMFGEKKMKGKLTCKDEFEDETPTTFKYNERSPKISTMSMFSAADIRSQALLNKDDDISAAEYEDLES